MKKRNIFHKHRPRFFDRVTKSQSTNLSASQIIPPLLSPQQFAWTGFSRIWTWQRPHLLPACLLPSWHVFDRPVIDQINAQVQQKVPGRIPRLCEISTRKYYHTAFRVIIVATKNGSPLEPLCCQRGLNRSPYFGVKAVFAFGIYFMSHGRR